MNPAVQLGLMVLMLSISVFIILMGIVIYNAYGFNMTAEQINETKILPYCYIKNQVLIDILNKTCTEIYGGPVE
jgi:hypothetical protein